MQVYTKLSFTLDQKDYCAYLLVKAVSLNNANDKVFYSIDKISHNAENIVSSSKLELGAYDKVSEHQRLSFKKVENSFSFNEKTVLFCLSTGEYLTTLQLTNRNK
tara:strand:+ start:316 stop:630 length:315 start_codon:yes stop_codon:yes gene_type:complete